MPSASDIARIDSGWSTSGRHGKGKASTGGELYNLSRVISLEQEEWKNVFAQGQKSESINENYRRHNVSSRLLPSPGSSSDGSLRVEISPSSPASSTLFPGQRRGNARGLRSESSSSSTGTVRPTSRNSLHPGFNNDFHSRNAAERFRNLTASPLYRGLPELRGLLSTPEPPLSPHPTPPPPPPPRRRSVSPLFSPNPPSPVPSFTAYPFFPPQPMPRQQLATPETSFDALPSYAGSGSSQSSWRAESANPTPRPRLRLITMRGPRREEQVRWPSMEGRYMVEVRERPGLIRPPSMGCFVEDIEEYVSAGESSEDEEEEGGGSFSAESLAEEDLGSLLELERESGSSSASWLGEEYVSALGSEDEDGARPDALAEENRRPERRSRFREEIHLSCASIAATHPDLADCYPVPQGVAKPALRRRVREAFWRWRTQLHRNDEDFEDMPYGAPQGQWIRRPMRYVLLGVVRDPVEEWRKILRGAFWRRRVVSSEGDESEKGDETSGR